MARIYNSRKALFQTPGGVGGGGVGSDEMATHVTLGSVGVVGSTHHQLQQLAGKSDIAEKALANVHADNEFQTAAADAHKERMGKLKLLLGEIDEDNWKYENISKLIGI